VIAKSSSQQYITPSSVFYSCGKHLLELWTYFPVTNFMHYSSIICRTILLINFQVKIRAPAPYCFRGMLLIAPALTVGKMDSFCVQTVSANESIAPEGKTPKSLDCWTVLVWKPSTSLCSVWIILHLRASATKLCSECSRLIYFLLIACLTNCFLRLARYHPPDIHGPPKMIKQSKIIYSR